MISAKGLQPPTYCLIYLLAAVGLHFVFPVARIIPPPWVLLGGLPILLGVAINGWANDAFKRQATTVKPYATPSALVTDGPFRFSRHPMYVGFVTILLGVAVLLGTVTPFVAPVAMGVTLGALFIPHEERALEEAFGGAYTRYAKRVRRWL